MQLLETLWYSCAESCFVEIMRLLCVFELMHLWISAFGGGLFLMLGTHQKNG